jgi:cytidylate kinase
MIIAIDGPAGAGKSTVARRVALELGFAYIDTGAMYRAVALSAHEAGLSCEVDVAEITQLGQGDVSSEIRSAEIGALTSQLAVLPSLREKVSARQRELGLQSERECGGAVLEGRDIQTVVFPDADLKIFLTATDEARAHRRLGQWAEKGQVGDFDLALRDIVERDCGACFDRRFNAR